MKYLYSGVSLKNGRCLNMDSLLLINGHIDKKKALLAVVCDGVGSMPEGDYASGAAARLLNGWFSTVTSTEKAGLRMRDAILDINTRIVAEAKQKNIETASTLSALLLIERD